MESMTGPALQNAQIAWHDCTNANLKAIAEQGWRIVGMVGATIIFGPETRLATSPSTVRTDVVKANVPPTNGKAEPAPMPIPPIAKHQREGD